VGLMFFAKKVILFTLIFSIYISIVNAASFEAAATPIDDRIVIDEFAKFSIEVKNNLKVKDEFRIYTLDFPTWDLRTEPIINPITIELGPGEKGSVEVLIDPLKIKDIGAYQVNANVKSRSTGQLISVPLKVTILSTTTLIQGYVPTVVTGVDISKKIDPRNELPIKILLNNQNIIDYPELTIDLESALIKKTISVQLGPKEEKTLEIKANLDPLTEPQEDKLVVALFFNNKSIINPIVRKLEIIEYAEPELIKEDKNLLISKQKFNFASNRKNYEGTFRLETTLLDSIFSSTNPKAKTIVENGKRFLVFDIHLENSGMGITVTRNFIPLFAAIILIIASLIAYYALRSPMDMRKESSNIIKKEGGTSAMTIILHIKNRTQNKLDEIEINDYIPGLVSIGGDVPIGALEPTKVLKHEKKGTTMVKWTIDSLEPSEERVLAYKTKSKLSILGSFNLPPAKANFKSGDKFYTSTSNSVSISE
jgi:hypothetical protein